jgi:hypothetical protein
MSETIHKTALEGHFRQLTDEKIERLASSNAHELRSEAIDILKEEIKRRGLPDELIAAIDRQTRAKLEATAEQGDRPKSKYFRTTMRWFLTASVGTIPLFGGGQYLPEVFWNLIVTPVFWPANLVFFLLGPVNIGVGPEAYGHGLALRAFYFLTAIPLNGIGWGIIGFLQLLARDVLHDGFRPHWRKVITAAILLSLIVGGVALRIPTVLNPLPPMRSAISTCMNIQACFANHLADPDNELPREINSWSELVNFFGPSNCPLEEKAEDHRLTFISYKALKIPGNYHEMVSGFALYFSIYKPPEGLTHKYIEVTMDGVRRLTQEEYSAFRKIRDALARYARISEDERFPHEIKDWKTLVSICNNNGANLSKPEVALLSGFVSYEEKAHSWGSNYVLRLEVHSPHSFPETETKEIRPF